MALQAFWNTRFSKRDFVYGKEPNAFFKSAIADLKPGKIFIPGAGEGRDAVFAAEKGWDVHCADISGEGRNKAMKLAAEREVEVSYNVADIRDVTYRESSFDAIASIFFHLPRSQRMQFYRDALNWLRPGGLFVMQAFTPKQLEHNSGGPKEPDLLVSVEQVANEINGFETIRLCEAETDLKEGSFHQGRASVVEYIGRKK